MNRALLIFYAIAIAFHAAIFFWLKPPTPKLPKILNETYVDVTLTAPPPKPEPAKPIVVPPPKPKIETPPPKLEAKPQPAPQPKPEMTIPKSKPQPTPPTPAPKPVVVSPPQPPREAPVTQRSLVMQVSHDYPVEALMRHEQGTVKLLVSINEQGYVDKVEILKSSGWPVLDSDAIRKIRKHHFDPIFQYGIPVRSSGTIEVPYRLQ